MTPYEQGYQDYHSHDTTNPYQLGTIDHNEWQLGYNDAKKDEFDDYGYDD